VEETNRRAGDESTPSHHIDGLFAAMGKRQRFEEDEKIFDEGDPATAVYKVVSGGVRLAKMTLCTRLQQNAGVYGSAVTC
jgi:CRP-like cAMP-binding protein